MVVLPHIRRKYMVGRLPSGAKVPMSACVVTLASDSVSYTGSARTVGVTVTWDDATLVVNTDYTLSWANNTNIGPATVTITGIGQFTGSVTRTFYIMEAVEPAWDFDITSASMVRGTSIPGVNLSYILPVVENYDNSGNAMLPVHFWLNGSWVKGFSLPKDGNGELHLENLDTTDAIVTDSDGAGGAYLHPFHYDRYRSFWFSNNGSYVVKAKDGTESPSFEGYIEAVPQSGRVMQFANGGRIIMSFQSGNKVHSFDLGSRYDISTVNLASKRTAVVGNNNDLVRACVFNSSGTQALFSKNDSVYLYHYSCPTPYSLDGATEIAKQSFQSTISRPTAFRIVNEGRTLLMSGSNMIYEYDLVA